MCNYSNNGHMIKFELYETQNSYQCHFAQIGSFVVSVAHYMRAYFNYQALTKGNSFALPDDVGYLNCIPLKMNDYGFEYVTADDANGEEQDQNSGDEEDQQQGILYAKVGCLAKETFSSNSFQLHVYTDKGCTEPYDDGQTDQQHASRGYEIDLDTYYNANDDANDDANGDAVKYTDYPVNTLRFSTKVSFRPSFYNCQNCKPSQISDTFNKFSGTYYDDLYISTYGMTQKAYSEYLAEVEAEQEAKCDNCQYFTYNTDDKVDDYNNVVQKVDDAYYNSVDDDATNLFVDDAYNQANGNYNYNADDGGGRQLRKLALPATTAQQPKQQNRRQKKSMLVPVYDEFKVRSSGF